ncbi:MAG: hypothetical protein QOC87_846, partial [Actinomycetota bacterium]|nr:hypothetical protein [Actinomycetota bacterium]
IVPVAIAARLTGPGSVSRAPAGAIDPP